MTAILLIIAAFVPGIMGLAFHWSGTRFSRGVAVAAGFMLAVCLFGALWLPAATCGIWLAMMGAVRLARRGQPGRCSWPWRVRARRQWAAQDKKAAAFILQRQDEALAEIRMELDSTDLLAPAIKHAPKQAPRRVALWARSVGSPRQSPAGRRSTETVSGHPLMPQSSGGGEELVSSSKPATGQGLDGNLNRRNQKLMGIKARFVAGAATLALAGGGFAALGAVTASAATPSCGSACDNISFEKFGTSDLLDTLGQANRQHQQIILFQRSNTDPAEDFVATSLGTVHSFYSHNHNLIAPGFDQQFGSLQAVQIQYEPYGVGSSDLCVGTWAGQVAGNGFKVRLEPCGQATTLWAVDTHKLITVHGRSYVPLITGTDTAFSNPLVLQYPGTSFPSDVPRPGLTVAPMNTYSDGTVFDNQMVTDTQGVVS